MPLPCPRALTLMTSKNNSLFFRVRLTQRYGSSSSLRFRERSSKQEILSSSLQSLTKSMKHSNLRDYPKNMQTNATLTRSIAIESSEGIDQTSTPKSRTRLFLPYHRQQSKLLSFSVRTTSKFLQCHNNSNHNRIKFLNMQSLSIKASSVMVAT